MSYRPIIAPSLKPEHLLGNTVKRIVGPSKINDMDASIDHRQLTPQFRGGYSYVHVVDERAPWEENPDGDTQVS
jgi:hypothetical protein